MKSLIVTSLGLCLMMSGGLYGQERVTVVQPVEAEPAQATTIQQGANFVIQEGESVRIIVPVMDPVPSVADPFEAPVPVAVPAKLGLLNLFPRNTRHATRMVTGRSACTNGTVRSTPSS